MTGCGQVHYIGQCHTFRRLAFSNKLAVVEESRLCRCCLMAGHMSAVCKKRGCSNCSDVRLGHHFHLCSKNVKNVPADRETPKPAQIPQWQPTQLVASENTGQTMNQVLANDTYMSNLANDTHLMRILEASVESTINFENEVHVLSNLVTLSTTARFRPIEINEAFSCSKWGGSRRHVSGLHEHASCSCNIHHYRRFGVESSNSKHDLSTDWVFAYQCQRLGWLYV